MNEQVALSPEEQEYFELFEPLVREFRPTDLNFIRKTWLKSFRHERLQTTDARYYEKQQKLINAVIQSDDTRVAVLCDAAHQDYIVGFLVCQSPPHDATKPLVLHYSFVKRAYRLQGLFKEMLQSMQWYKGRNILCTHWTRNLFPIGRNMKMEFDDWILKNVFIKHDYDEESEWK